MQLLKNLRSEPGLTTSLKGLAILAVLAIHSLTLLPDGSYTGTWHVPIIAFDQLMRFCVPAFIFLSGYGLGLKYPHQLISPITWLLKRLRKILPLYLLWTAYFVALSLIIPRWEDITHYWSWVQIWFMGRGEYHLYFIPVLIELYVILALIKWRRAQVPGWLVVITLLIQAATSIYFSVKPNAFNDQYQYALITSWAGYFFLGTWLAGIGRFLRRRLGLLLALIGWLAASTYALHIINAGGNVVAALRSTKLSVMAYSLGILAVFLDEGKRQFSGNSILIWLGKYSYIIYLAHTLPLSVAKLHLPSITIIYIYISYLVILFVSIRINNFSFGHRRS